MVGINKCCDKFVEENKKYKLSQTAFNNVPFKIFEIKKQSFLVNETIYVVGCNCQINENNIEKITSLLLSTNQTKGVSYIIIAEGSRTILSEKCYFFDNATFSHFHYLLVTPSGMIKNDNFSYSLAGDVKKLIEIICDDFGFANSSSNVIQNSVSTANSGSIASQLDALTGSNGESDEDDFVKITGNL